MFQRSNSPKTSLLSDAALGGREGPVVVFINVKSGGQAGQAVLQRFQDAQLPNVHVYNMADGGPQSGLETHAEAEGARVLVAGGDGTVDWVLAIMLERLRLPPVPVGILPLGTGNDMSRCTNWGPSYDSSFRPERLIQQVRQAQPVQLDRWLVTVQEGMGTEETEPKLMVLCNYFSFGLDAKAALGFHQLREKRPGLFKIRLMNIVWYGVTGTKEMFIPMANLGGRAVSFAVDGKKLDIPSSCKSVVVLNIDSYMGGADLFGSRSRSACCLCCCCGTPPEEEDIASISDGRLEIVGMGGGISQTLTKLCGCRGKRLAQGSEIEIKIATRPNQRPLAAQVDGEPWLLPRTCTISITKTNAGMMLQRAKH
eukprot:TRINITY_DN48227_c0_g1_i1.p1 TRINITY_DN48227_c0_g1~~TRINITY_DN48227_c0_g1_i1.p1  ORF type:complete len:368 (-),score=19.56 TRINITY_DN48227_c0_g1_i1:305-1408(-)